MNIDGTNKSLESVSVLIDTWWNVNRIVTGISSLAQKVLIDTWWNVNTSI